MLARIVTTRIDKPELHQTLIEYLVSRFTYNSKSEWLKQIETGCIILNGKCASPEMPLKNGDLLEYKPPVIAEPNVDWNINVIFQNDVFIVLDKPGNLPCHPAGCYFNNTLWAALKQGYVAGVNAMDNIHFVSRLDRETSGIVLVAKNPTAAKMLAKQLAKPDSCKTYQVLVEGDFPEEMQADGWLFKSPDSIVSKKRSFSYEKPDLPAETASTIFRCLKKQNGISLLEAKLNTGRMHQIRATLCSLGFPVVGDKLYGIDETMFIRFIEHRLTEEDMLKLRINRQALHAWKLSFDNFNFTSEISWNIDFL